jgi:hypothetical protein
LVLAGLVYKKGETMEHIEKAAGKGIESLFDYGAAMAVLLLALLCTAWTIRYLLNRCDERFDQALKRHEETTAKMGEILDRNTTAYAQSVVMLSDVKAALQNIPHRMG